MSTVHKLTKQKQVRPKNLKPTNLINLQLELYESWIPNKKVENGL